LALLSVLLISAYRRIVPAVRWQTQAGSLRLAYFIVTIAYNFTEAGFKTMHPMWITLLLAAMVAPEGPLPEYSPPLGLDHSDDFAECKPVTAKSSLRSRPGRPFPQSVHREDLQWTRQL